MEPFFTNERGQLYCGNSLEILKKLQSNSIDQCITSPPYFGLRAYSAEPVLWDGEPGCEHEFQDEHTMIKRRELEEALSDKQKSNRGYLVSYMMGQTCTKCSGWFGNLGQEPHPDLFTKNLTMIFSEVFRVLKPHGTLWLNLGDSFAGSLQAAGKERASVKQGSNRGTRYMWEKGHKSILAKLEGYKNKDLLGIPWKVAFSLRDSGWYLRNDNIWAKGTSGQEDILDQVLSCGERAGIEPDKLNLLMELLNPFVGNPMPESVKDRHSRSHEYFFHFSKSKNYYTDMNLIKEADRKNGSRNRRTVWTILKTRDKSLHTAGFPEELIRSLVIAGCPQNGTVLDVFMGSGTVARVAESLNKNWIGIEISQEYCEQDIIPSLKSCQPVF